MLENSVACRGKVWLFDHVIIYYCVFLALSGCCEGGKGLICDSYWADKGTVNRTETCENVDDHCFVLWGQEIINNKTLLVVIRKGCFKIALHKNYEYCLKDCIQNPKYDAFSSKNISGFCCCTEDLCNVNFTAVDYEEDVSTVASTTGRGKVIQFSLAFLQHTRRCMSSCTKTNQSSLAQFILQTDNPFG